MLIASGFEKYFVMPSPFFGLQQYKGAWYTTKCWAMVINFYTVLVPKPTLFNSSWFGYVNILSQTLFCRRHTSDVEPLFLYFFLYLNMYKW